MNKVQNELRPPFSGREEGEEEEEEEPSVCKLTRPIPNAVA